jgi:hypothetical protein
MVVTGNDAGDKQCDGEEQRFGAPFRLRDLFLDHGNGPVGRPFVINCTPLAHARLVSSPNCASLLA